MNIGLMISTQRIKNNLSREKLAQKVGCTSRAIEYWESGKRNISLDNADKIFKALGATLTIGDIKEHEQ